MIDAIRPVRGYRNACTYRVRLSGDDYWMLRHAAIARGTKAEALLNTLIGILLREKLIDAVLDDKNQSAAGAAGTR
jgi:hypothetical protein